VFAVLFVPPIIFAVLCVVGGGIGLGNAARDKKREKPV
jgi:hypothetical protein